MADTQEAQQAIVDAIQRLATGIGTNAGSGMVESTGAAIRDLGEALKSLHEVRNRSSRAGGFA